MNKLIDARRMCFATLLVLLPIASEILWTVYLELGGGRRRDLTTSTGTMLLGRLAVLPSQWIRWGLILWLALRRPLASGTGPQRTLIYVGAFILANACLPLVAQLTRQVLRQDPTLRVFPFEEGFFVPQAPLVFAFFASVFALSAIRWFTGWTIIDPVQGESSADIRELPPVTITKLMAFTLVVALLVGLVTEIQRTELAKAESQLNFENFWNQTPRERIESPGQTQRAPTVRWSVGYRRQLLNWSVLGAVLVAPVLALSVNAFICGGWAWIAGPLYYVVVRLALERWVLGNSLPLDLLVAARYPWSLMFDAMCCVIVGGLSLKLLKRLGLQLVVIK